jgi:hypothetical protein
MAKAVLPIFRNIAEREAHSAQQRVAAVLMARYRIDELKSGDVSLLIGLLGKIGFSPKDRGALNLPTNST